MEHPRCCICGSQHERFRDAAHTKAASYCLSCHASHMRRTRPKYRQLSAQQRQRVLARSIANVYQRRGKLVPQACQRCGSQHAQKHHPDYSQPLRVLWLCHSCHRTAHAT